MEQANHASNELLVSTPSQAKIVGVADTDYSVRLTKHSLKNVRPIEFSLDEGFPVNVILCS